VAREARQSLPSRMPQGLGLWSQIRLFVYLGSNADIKVAKDAVSHLILGSPVGNAYSKLRAVTARLAEIR